uniref:ATP-dependent DNA helicase n=1 Tax=Nicotiana sylvestris TaxID=4096 RepID=A0A1U7XCZ0_NICSY|nr:PREDICTED: ATP-dependent DNA helicase PIF1-like [Nicotiana sylvestris]
MANRQTIETVDRSFRDIMDINEPFGGKVMVFGGDFRQVLPVVPKSTRAETINTRLVKSYLWNKMKKIQLIRNMRARADPTFSNFLLRISNGKEPTIRDDMVLLPEKLIVKHDGDSTGEDNLIREIMSSCAKYMTERAILASRNEYIDQLNEMLIAKFPGESRTFLSFDSAEDDTNNYYQEEYLNTLTPSGLPPHKLVLKKNALIMLLRNLDPTNGLSNGTRMICGGFDNNIIHAEIMMGENASKHVFIPRIQLSSLENEGYPFRFIRKQFPLLAGLLGVESGQDAVLRALLYERGRENVEPYEITVAEFTNRISELRNKLGRHGLKDEGLKVKSTVSAEEKLRGNILAGDKCSLSYDRTLEEIL